MALADVPHQHASTHSKVDVDDTFDAQDDDADCWSTSELIPNSYWYTVYVWKVILFLSEQVSVLTFSLEVSACVVFFHSDIM